uniref:Uncharacterized protein n=1 Tax=Tetradesmus obliquus TaxID=3088 RepID=A0A383V7W8_TETOB
MPAAVQQLQQQPLPMAAAVLQEHSAISAAVGAASSSTSSNYKARQLLYDQVTSTAAADATAEAKPARAPAAAGSEQAHTV